MSQKLLNGKSKFKKNYINIYANLLVNNKSRFLVVTNQTAIDLIKDVQKNLKSNKTIIDN